MWNLCTCRCVELSNLCICICMEFGIYASASAWNLEFIHLHMHGIIEFMYCICMELSNLYTCICMEFEIYVLSV
jgi:hypothetical protein